MKLNPPASSSDLETARQIARRLHQNRRRDDPAAASWTADEAPRPRLTPPPLPSRPAPAAAVEPPPRETIAARHAEPAARQVPRPAPEPSFELPEAPPFERPSWREPEPEPVTSQDERIGIEEPLPEPPSLEDLAEPDEPSAFVRNESQADPELDMPDVDVDEPALSPEEMIGEAAHAESSPFDQLTEPEAEPAAEPEPVKEPEDSPFDDALLDAPPVAEEPSPLSWDEIVERCLELAQARGAMLIDPAGQVFASRGDWPAPGPDAIAGKLVVMMAKTLKDAPTRSISAPLMGMHLTAWRVPLSEGLVTAAFIGAAPLRAEARPAIDAEILSGVGN